MIKSGCDDPSKYKCWKLFRATLSLLPFNVKLGQQLNTERGYKRSAALEVQPKTRHLRWVNNSKTIDMFSRAKQQKYEVKMHVYEVENLSKLFFCRCHSCCPRFLQRKKTNKKPSLVQSPEISLRANFAFQYDTPGWISQSKQSIPICDWRAEPLSLHL